MNSASVDLIYLDPPFNSKANYAAPIGSKAAGAAPTWAGDRSGRAGHLPRPRGVPLASLGQGGGSADAADRGGAARHPDPESVSPGASGRVSAALREGLLLGEARERLDDRPGPGRGVRDRAGRQGSRPGVQRAVRQRVAPTLRGGRLRQRPAPGPRSASRPASRRDQRTRPGHAGRHGACAELAPSPRRWLASEGIGELQRRSRSSATIPARSSCE